MTATKGGGSSVDLNPFSGCSSGCSVFVLLISLITVFVIVIVL